MFREVEPLTMFEIMHTHGFWKLMSVIWVIPLIVFISYIIKCKLNNEKII